MKIVSSNALKKTMQIIKSALAGKEPSFTKNSGFNLRRTDVTENDSLKVFTAKGALDLQNSLNNAKTDKGGYVGTANDLKIIADEARVAAANASVRAELGIEKAEEAKIIADEAKVTGAKKLDKGGYVGTANDLNNSISSVNQKTDQALSDSSIALRDKLNSTNGVANGLTVNGAFRIGNYTIEVEI
ncbi:MAG: hypothetical protein ACRCZ2_07265 [Fusobacteriaceae bacterium]